MTPHGCVNTSQSFLPDVWTIICVNNPDFNDIGREVFFNGAWEAWLTNHIVRAMINYPGAVLLGETRVKTIPHNTKVQQFRFLECELGMISFNPFCK